MKILIFYCVILLVILKMIIYDCSKLQKNLEKFPATCLRVYFILYIQIIG